MARVGLTKIHMLILTREVKQSERSVSKLAGNHHGKLKKDQENKDEKRNKCWIPHHRNGVYFPQGHESVIDDVPYDTLSFRQTYWLRNVDGVDKPEPMWPLS